MKKIFLVTLVILLVSAFVFGGCAKPAPAPAPAPAPTLAPAPAPAPAPTPAPAKPIKLKFSYATLVNTVFYTDGWAPWAEEIKQRTTAIGKPVEIVFFGGGALASNVAQYDITKTGLTDISGCWSPAEHPGVFPLSEIWTLPFLVPGSLVAGLAEQELFDTQLAFRQEFENAGLKILGFQPTVNNILNTRTKQVKTMEDLKGVKTNIVGGGQSQTVSALGGVPVQMAPPDVYLALERGLIEATTSHPQAIFTFKLNEITKYRTIFPAAIFNNPLVTAMNPDSFNRLPPEVQKIFDELSGMYMTRLVAGAMDTKTAKEHNTLVEYDKKAGNPEMYRLPDTEFQRWVEITKPVRERLIAELEAKGLPARSFYEEAVRLVEKYSK